MPAPVSFKQEAGEEITAAGEFQAGNNSNLRAEAQATPDLTVKIKAGQVFFGTRRVEKSSDTNSSAFSPPGSNNRIDILVIDVAGTFSIIQGTAAASPVMPNIPTDKIPIVAVYLRTGTTEIWDDDSASGANGVDSYIYQDLRPAYNATGSGNIIEIEAEETIGDGKPFYINFMTGKADLAHGYKEVASGSFTAPTGAMMNIERLNSTQFLMLGCSGNTLTIYVKDNTGADVASATVTTTFANGGAPNNQAGCARIDDNKFIIFWKKQTSNDLRFRTGSISGGTITMDTADQAAFSAPTVNDAVVVCNGLEDGKCGIAYVTGSSQESLNLRYVTVAQNTATSVYNTSASNGTNGISNGLGVRMGRDGVLVGASLWQDASGSNRQKVLAVTIDSNNGDLNNYNLDNAWGTNITDTPLPLIAADEGVVFYQQALNATSDAEVCWRINMRKRAVRRYAIELDEDNASAYNNSAPMAIASRHCEILVSALGFNNRFIFINDKVIPFGHTGRIPGFGTYSGIGFVNLLEDEALVFTSSNYYRIKLPTRIDGVALVGASAGSNILGELDVATNMSGLTAFRDVYLKDDYSSEGDVNGQGYIKAGKAVSTTKMYINRPMAQF